MEKRSRHWGNTYKWVEKIINSVNTPEQYKTASRLIKNWHRQYYNTKTKYPNQIKNIRRELEYKLSQRLGNLN